jgi:hypothetical protein
MEILEDEDDWLLLRFAVRQRLERIDNEAAPPRRIELHPRLIRHGHIEYRQQGIDRRAQPFVDCQQPAEATFVDLPGVVACLDTKIAAQQIGDGQIGCPCRISYPETRGPGRRLSFRLDDPSSEICRGPGQMVASLSGGA